MADISYHLIPRAFCNLRTLVFVTNLATVKYRIVYSEWAWQVKILCVDLPTLRKLELVDSRNEEWDYSQVKPMPEAGDCKFSRSQSMVIVMC